jgi:hypothetical protein
MRIALVGALAVVLPVLPAQAGWLGTGGTKLPKPAAFMDKKANETHKMAVHVQKLNPKYNSPTWGSTFSATAKQENRPLKPYLR